MCLAWLFRRRKKKETKKPIEEEAVKRPAEAEAVSEVAPQKVEVEIGRAHV